MKTYSELKLYPPINWSKILSQKAIEFTTFETKNLLRLSESWVTCACGNQCARLPRYSETGEPVDPVLRERGLRFSAVMTELATHVERMHNSGCDQSHVFAVERILQEARIVLNNIEQRASILLAKNIDQS